MLKKITIVFFMLFLMVSHCVPTAAHNAGASPVYPITLSVEFFDVSPHNEHHDAISKLAINNIIGGYDDGSFRPESSISRAEITAIICRTAGLEPSFTSMVFSDVLPSHWASGYIETAQRYGIINGMGDGTFNPEGLVTYEQIIKMVVAALGYEREAISNGGYPYGYLSVGYDIGLTNNVSWFSSNDPASRGAVAQIIYNGFFFSDFEEYFEQNPIDAAYNTEMETAFSTYDMVQCTHKYAEIWKAEVSRAYQGILELSSNEEYDLYLSLYNMWLDNGDLELQERLDYYDEYERTGGTMDSLIRGGIAYEYYKEAAKFAYSLLFAFDNTYVYLFEYPDASNGLALPDGDYFIAV